MAETDMNVAKYILKYLGKKNVFHVSNREKYYGEISNMRAVNDKHEVMLLF